MEESCDVLVAGCGPAGAAAALCAAKKGAKVICIEEKRVIGRPVRCAEGIGGYLLGMAKTRIPKEQLRWKISGVVLREGGRESVKSGGFWEGWTIERQKFEPWLAGLAKAAGAEIITDAKLVDAKFDADGVMGGAVVECGGKRRIFRPRMVVAADGSESAVRALSGRFALGKKHFAAVYSWEFAGAKIEKPHFEQIYFGPFAPDGYAYIFPKSETVANVGVGSCGTGKSMGEMREIFPQFLELPEVKRQLAGAKKVAEKSGRPLVDDRGIGELSFGNVLLAGDAAGFNLKPFVEGILPAMICGEIAGECAAEMAKGKKMDYASRLNERMGEVKAASDESRDALFNAFRLPEEKKYRKLFEISDALG